MSFCCGASMIGLIGSIRNHSVLVHQVPLLCCPVCQRLEIHPEIKEEFELVVEYALEDHVKEITLRETITPEMIAEWREHCVSFIGDEDFELTLREQIDHSLDLLSVAKCLSEDDWKEELMQRLSTLTYRLQHLEQQKEKKR